MSSMRVSAWWMSAPEHAESAFDVLAGPPSPLQVDGEVPGFPERTLRLDELQTIVRAARTPHRVRVAVWRVLVLRARYDGPDWTVAWVGLAMPGLRRRAQLLADRRGGDAWQDAVLTGFLTAVRLVEHDDRPGGRLWDPYRVLERPAMMAANHVYRRAGRRLAWVRLAVR
ncbi:hypothetical protein ACTMTJ_35000 [Phytohabitans sp. LJ34]|uniref:hypothetical protein n=1 Tax=Phytohabitans sp. LJ34 TaxID=3452217 RepID=UPI003F89EF9F